MEDWEFYDWWEWDEEEDHQAFLYTITAELAELFFLSDNGYMADDLESYDLGHLDAASWWSLVDQLDGMVNLAAIVDVAHTLDDLLRFPRLPTGLLESPLAFLETVLEGNLPREPSGRRVNSRRLVKIALAVIQLLREFPPAAQAAVGAWANVHRQLMGAYEDFGLDDEDLADFLFAPDLPPAVTGFSMMIGMTLMRWPERAEGLPLPSDFLDPDLYDEVLEQWEALPGGPAVTEEGNGEAEALFAQGRLAHMLAELGSVEGLDPDDIGEEDVNLAYSRLSRAILWMHNQCRHCSEREEVVCKVADNWPERPVALLDIAGEIANTGRIGGCIKM